MEHQQATFLVQFMTQLWEGEFPATCKVLAAVPEARRDYRPDDKSRTAWELVVHLATSDVWFLDSTLSGNFAYNPDTEKQLTADHPKVESVVGWYTKTFPAKLNAVRAMPADDMTRVVDFFGLFKRPAVSYLGFGNNHSIHHRGQLAAYLRSMGGKVPAIYGGSADEPWKG
jgi:uncharacterized damage-inducible protein DinB